MQDRIVTTCAATEHVGLAYFQNSIPFVSEIVIENTSASDLADLVVSLASEPLVIKPTDIRIDRIAAGQLYRIENPDVRLDPVALAGFSEASALQLSVSVAIDGDVRSECLSQIRLLPSSHWGGSSSAPELLAAFVRPNEPAIDVVLRDAASKLAAAGRDPALNGYSGNPRSRIWEMAEAFWVALAERRLAYVLPPASFERTGQKVRGPSEVLERQVGTCLDTSLLYAAALEQAGLHPILVLIPGHAFVGVWLKDDDFASATIDDMQILRKRRDLQDLILVETTLLTGARPAPFAVAVERGARYVDENAVQPLEVAVDIHRCRLRGIRPLDLGGAGQLGIAPVETKPVDLVISAPPVFREEIPPAEIVEEKALDRLERWKRRLLDLTLRNKLLNFKPGKNAIVIECVDSGALEDRLAAGSSFKMMPRSDVLDGSDERNRALFERRHLDDGRRRYLTDALARDEIHTTLQPEELDDRLLDLFRLVRNGFEEGGANILFLAIGFLSWTRKDGETPYRAPLLLVPVSLKRASVRAGFRLTLHDDDARFNPTLSELLRQEFDLRMPEFAGDLPRDASGLDIERILAIVRAHVRDLKGWEVLPDVVLSTFSFNKYLMWRDLVERAEILKRNPVVRHLLDTPTHSYGDGSPFPEPDRLDREYKADARGRRPGPSINGGGTRHCAWASSPPRTR